MKKLVEEYGPWAAVWGMIIVIGGFVGFWSEKYHASLPKPNEDVIYVRKDNNDKYPHLSSKEEGFRAYNWPYESKVPKLFIIKAGTVCEITADMIE